MSHTIIQLGAALFRDLQYAAIDPKKRCYFIFRALNKYLTVTESAGVALIRYPTTNEHTQKLTYCGPEQGKMEKWLQERIAVTVEATVANIDTTPPVFSYAKTQLLPYMNGLLIIWHQNELDTSDEHHNVLVEYLEAISYVEENERLYFYRNERAFEPELSKRIQQKEQDGITELLALTKAIGNCDFVFWGDANSSYIEVATHLGSQDSGFGFQLPVGKGIGGNVAQNKRLLQVNDYKNCEYRYQEVSTTVDKENLRSILALPVKDKEVNTSGVLYASNRDVEPFPLKTKLMLLRLGQSIEPLTKQKELKHFFTNNQSSKNIKQKKSELRKIIQRAKQLDDLEIWLEDFLKGIVIIVDENKQQYTTRLKKTSTNKNQPYTYSLKHHNQNLGELLIWTTMKLPPDDWPDLIDDVIHGIYIIMERKERIHHLIELERSQWINSLMDSSTDLTNLYKKGIQLGIPLDRGEVWTIYWNLNDKRLSSLQKVKLEEVVLKTVKAPLIFAENTGFIIFNKSWQCHPEELRNQLLKQLPVTTWIIHSAIYSSFRELQNNVKQLQLLLKQITTFEQKKYIIEFNDFGLDYLLTNPMLTDELKRFSNKIFQPIMIYDQENKTQLTKTFALYLVYQSPPQVAKKLYIHTNTVHYRVNRAKELLDIDLDKLGNDIALRLAAYTWFYHQEHEQNQKVQ